MVSACCKGPNRLGKRQGALPSVSPEICMFHCVHAARLCLSPVSTLLQSMSLLQLPAAIHWLQTDAFLSTAAVQQKTTLLSHSALLSCKDAPGQS